MPILTTILGIVFVFYLTQAFCETIWGICLIINGLFWRAIALVLHSFAIALHSYEKINRIKKRKQRAKRIQVMMANPFFSTMLQIHRSKQARMAD